MQRVRNWRGLAALLVVTVAAVGLFAAGCEQDCEKTATCPRVSSASGGAAGVGGAGGSGGEAAAGGAGGSGGGAGGQSSCGNALVDPGELCLTGEAQPFGVLGYAAHVKLIDCDNDNDLDVLMSTGLSSNSAITVLPNNGRGLLGNAIESTSSDGAGSFVVGDFDATAGIDLATGSSYTINNVGKFTVWTGGNDCTFSPVSSYDTTGVTIGMATMDFNNDIFADPVALIAAGQQLQDKLAVLFSGTTNFSEMPTGYEGLDNFLSADLNNDNSDDVLFTLSDPNALLVSLIDINGGTDTTFPLTSGGVTSGVVLGDLDGDNDLDAVITSLLEHAVLVLVNDGNGQFTIMGDPVPLEGEGTMPARFPGLPQLADMDADGDLDVVAVSLSDKSDVIPDDSLNGNSSVSVLLNDGAGNLSLAAGFPRGVQHLPSGVGLADMNGDGAPDIVMAHGFNDTSLASILFADP